jgi:hypothetical protein
MNTHITLGHKVGHTNGLGTKGRPVIRVLKSHDHGARARNRQLRAHHG